MAGIEYRFTGIEELGVPDVCCEMGVRRFVWAEVPRVYGALVQWPDLYFYLQWMSIRPGDDRVVEQVLAEQIARGGSPRLFFLEWGSHKRDSKWGVGLLVSGGIDGSSSQEVRLLQHVGIFS